MAGWIVRLSGLMAMLAMTACGTVPPGGPSPGTPAEVAELKQAILDLGPGVDPEEAARAASVAYSWTHELALKYQIRDNPIIHNTEVNLGLKPRGLCWQWAEDMEKRLKQENFHTLVIYRAIATPGNPFRLEHSTAIVSRKGDGMYQGLVLDPWRKGGILTWLPVLDDPRYHWRPAAVVLEERQLKELAKAKLGK